MVPVASLRMATGYIGSVRRAERETSFLSLLITYYQDSDRNRRELADIDMNLQY